MTIYDDIIDLPHWEPQNYRRMAMEARAAQFAPFAALNGHDDAINETARITDQQLELDCLAIEDLNAKMATLIDRIAQQPTIEVTYFSPDTRKSGGAYVTYRGEARRVDHSVGSIIFRDGMEIALNVIKSLDGAIFADDSQS